LKNGCGKGLAAGGVQVGQERKRAALPAKVAMGAMLVERERPGGRAVGGARGAMQVG